VLEDHPFVASLHDRAGFDCGVPALNAYLRQFADQHRRKGITNIYVLADSAAPSTIVGYYTLSAAEVDVARLTDADRKRLPRFPVPCFRMGRLACRIDRQGEGRLRRGSLPRGAQADRGVCAARRCQGRGRQTLLWTLRVRGAARCGVDAVLAARAVRLRKSPLAALTYTLHMHLQALLATLTLMRASATSCLRAGGAARWSNPLVHAAFVD
jgi:hypothetical protein